MAPLLVLVLLVVGGVRAALPPADMAWLRQDAARMINGSRLAGVNGTTLYTPDASSSYGAQWTRDFYCKLERKERRKERGKEGRKERKKERKKEESKKERKTGAGVNGRMTEEEEGQEEKEGEEEEEGERKGHQKKGDEKEQEEDDDDGSDE